MRVEEPTSDGDEEEPAVLDLVVNDDPRVRRGRRRRGRPRAVTIRRITQAELRVGAIMFPRTAEQELRPRTRGECAGAARPCPWVSCRHHLYLEVSPETGSIKINYPDREPWELEQTCSIDVAEQGGLTLEEVGEITNLTRERIRQVEVKALLQVRAAARSLLGEDAP